MSNTFPKGRLIAVGLVSSLALTSCGLETEYSGQPLPDAPLIEQIYNISTSPAMTDNQPDYIGRQQETIGVIGGTLYTKFAQVEGKKDRSQTVLDTYCKAGADFQSQMQVAPDRALNNYSFLTSGIRIAYVRLRKEGKVTDIDNLTKAAHDQCPESVPYRPYLPATG